jgi:ubiquinone/menaquinone biosynthesis C-methylase UbiE
MTSIAMKNKIAFQCTRCCVEFDSSGDRLRCPSCGANASVHDSIPSFTDNDDYFFGEISREDMVELAAAVGRIGWDAAFDEMCDKQTDGLREYIRQYIADASRASWKYLLQLPDDGTVLDFGCGWGETTLSLARSVRRVVSMDLTMERLLLLQARTRDQGLSHVTFAHGGDALPLPFANETFDAVVLNGVLEWVPVTGDGDPRQCQLAILRELRRTLKPTGQVYIGIENRVGLKYFLGSIDEHSRMKYTSLLPRWLANQWSRAKRGEDYRTYTYSRRGYTQLLEEAGFQQADFHCPYPDYREFDRIVPVTAGAVKRLFRPTSAWKRAILQTPLCSQLLKWAVPSFSIVAGNAAPDASRLHRIVNDVSSRIGVDLETPVSLHSRPIGEVFAYCARAGETEPTILLRIAETQTAIDARLASAKHLESLWEHGQGQCMEVIPQSKGHGIVTDGVFTAEEFKQGVSWQKIDHYRITPGNALAAVSGWLTDFQMATKSHETWKPREMRAHVAALSRRVQELLPVSPEGLSQQNRTPSPGSKTERFDGIPVVVSHGDLHLDNVLFSQTDGTLTGVIDWDLGSMRGLPMTDLIYLLLVYGMEVKGQTYSRTVQSILNPTSLSAAERKALQEYETAFALDGAYRTFAIQAAVLENIVTLSARRPAAFKRLENDLMTLPLRLWHSGLSTEGVGSRISA